MKKTIKALLATTALYGMAPVEPAYAQCTGQFGAYTICGNATGSTALPRSAPTAGFLNGLCTTSGAMPVGTGATWVCSTSTTTQRFGLNIAPTGSATLEIAQVSSDIAGGIRLTRGGGDVRFYATTTGGVIDLPQSSTHKLHFQTAQSERATIGLGMTIGDTNLTDFGLGTLNVGNTALSAGLSGSGIYTNGFPERFRKRTDLDFYANAATGTDDVTCGLSATVTATEHPCRTLQQMVNNAQERWDKNGNNVFTMTFHVADGTYEGVTFAGPFVGQNGSTSQKLVGNLANKAAVIIAPAGGGNCIGATSGANLQVVGGFTFDMTNSADCISVFDNATLYLGIPASIPPANVTPTPDVFTFKGGSPSGLFFDILVGLGGTVHVSTSYTRDGTGGTGSSGHLNASSASTIIYDTNGVPGAIVATFTNNPTFGDAFAYVAGASYLQYQAVQNKGHVIGGMVRGQGNGAADLYPAINGQTPIMRDAHTTLSGTFAGGATSVTVTCPNNINNGYSIGIALNAGGYHWTSVNGAITHTPPYTCPASTTVTLTTALPSAANSGNDVLVTQSGFETTVNTTVASGTSLVVARINPSVPVQGFAVGVTLDNGMIFWSRITAVSGTVPATLTLAQAIPSNATAGNAVIMYSALFPGTVASAQATGTTALTSFPGGSPTFTITTSPTGIAVGQSVTCTGGTDSQSGIRFGTQVTAIIGSVVYLSKVTESQQTNVSCQFIGNLSSGATLLNT